MTKVIEQASAPVTSGIILHSAGLYDFLASVMMLGRERSFREKVIDLARIKAGESVLDVHPLRLVKASTEPLKRLL